MRFDVLTIFPEMFRTPLAEGILRRARQQGKLEVLVHDIRAFATGRHKNTDDRPFGGGEGMVMKPEPIAAAIRHVQSLGDGDGRRPGRVLLLTPQGRCYNQRQAAALAAEDRLVVVCGRYEGVDERICELFVDEEISIGDYILSGGELAAMVLIDSVARLLPGVLGSWDSAVEETFSRGLLKHPQYTRPRVFEGRGVPEPLLSGDHAAVAGWRFAASVRRTRERRPDLLEGHEFSREERDCLKRYGVET